MFSKLGSIIVSTLILTNSFVNVGACDCCCGCCRPRDIDDPDDDTRDLDEDIDQSNNKAVQAIISYLNDKSKYKDRNNKDPYLFDGCVVPYISDTGVVSGKIVRIKFNPKNFFIADTIEEYKNIDLNNIGDVKVKCTFKNSDVTYFSNIEISLKDLVSSFQQIETAFYGRADDKTHYLCIRDTKGLINNGNNVYLDINAGIIYTTGNIQGGGILRDSTPMFVRLRKNTDVNTKLVISWGGYNFFVGDNTIPKEFKGTKYFRIYYIVNDEQKKQKMIGTSNFRNFISEKNDFIDKDVFKNIKLEIVYNK